MSLAQETEPTLMETRQLHSSQKEAIKKITEFSGEANELDIDEWLFDLNNLFSLMKLKDEARILETMGKLIGPALRWYQENLRSFANWSDAEMALRDRFREFTSDSQLMQEFFHIYQEENESVTSFYEKVIRKYRKTRQFITEQQVITVLQNGVMNSLKEYLIRNEKDITKPDEWLQVAREEEYIQKRIQQQNSNSYLETNNQSFFHQRLPTATIQAKPPSTQLWNPQSFLPQHYYKKQYQQIPSSINNPMYSTRKNFSNFQQKQNLDREKTTQHSNSCLICKRKKPFYQ